MMPDWSVEEVGGAFLGQGNPSWKRVSRALSSDEEILVEVHEMHLGFRILSFRKRSGDPQWKGTWWTEVSGPIGAADHAEAMQIANELL